MPSEFAAASRFLEGLTAFLEIRAIGSSSSPAITTSTEIPARRISRRARPMRAIPSRPSGPNGSTTPRCSPSSIESSPRVPSSPSRSTEPGTNSRNRAPYLWSRDSTRPSPRSMTSRRRTRTISGSLQAKNTDTSAEWAKPNSGGSRRDSTRPRNRVCSGSESSITTAIATPSLMTRTSGTPPYWSSILENR